jgi:chromosome partitioning protein
MLSASGPKAPHKIVVLNPKGGSGKTTLATNLAAWCAVHGGPTALMDYDPQGCSTRWLSNRAAERPAIHGIAAYRLNLQMTRSWQLRTPPGTHYLVVDTSAAIPAQRISEYTRGAQALIIPVGPTDIDTHAAAGFIRDLLLVAKEHRADARIAVVANRVRQGTVAHNRLMRFLDTLEIPCLTILRDSQVYAHAAQHGLGLHEFKPGQVRRDLAQWAPLLDWVKRRCNPPGVSDIVARSAPASSPSPTQVASALMPPAFALER